MASTYYPDVVTDDLLKQLERRIAKEYRAAATECYQDAQDYFIKFADRYKKEYAAYKKGAYTKQEFDNWVMTQVARGKGWTQLADELADRCCQANRVAAAYINDSTPGIYSLNYNFEAYAIDQAYNNSLSFHAYDEQTVRRLMMQDEIKLPRINPNYASDFLWNKKKMNSALISNILQGKDIYQLAGSFMAVTNMNHNAAVRNARTAYTGAQNAGRQASYLQAEQMGIEIKKEWIATLDTRTRTSHQHLDGERVDNFAKFSNGLMYPGDMSGHPSELYNCRCTMRAIMPGINDSRDTSRRGRESEPWIDENGRVQQGNNTIFKGTTYTGIDGTMSYKDWLKAKKNNNNDDAPIKTKQRVISGSNRAMIEEKQIAKIDLSNINIDDDSMINNAIDYSEGFDDYSINRFNEIINEASFIESNNGCCYNKLTNQVELDVKTQHNSTIFHEVTHWLDENQHYTIVDDWGHFKREYDDDGNIIGKVWVKKLVTIKENAGFSDFISWEWQKSHDNNDSALVLDMRNVVSKLGISGTYGLERQNAPYDVKAINDYLYFRGVSKSDEDYVHISDFISAMTYDTNLGSLIGGGHSYDYWVDGGDSIRVSEIIAGYNVLKARGRDDLIEIEKELAPNLMSMIEKEWKNVW